MGRLPNVYLVGAPKAGTTSLAHWLARHPDVHFSVPKEPYYWAYDYPRLRAHYGFETFQAYAGLFASEAAQRAPVIAEGSTVYLYSETAVPEIMAANPSAKVILALRNPPDLLVSYHRTQVVALNEDELDFGRAWRRSLTGGLPATDPLDVKLVDYPTIGRLGLAVDRLVQVTPAAQIHVVQFEDLQNRPDHVWRQLCSFLELTPEPSPTFVVRNKSTKQYRSAWIRQLTHRPPDLLQQPMRHARQWSRTTQNRTVRAVKQWMWRPAPRPDAVAGLRLDLAAYFASDIAQLERRLGLDLSAWKAGGQAPPPAAQTDNE